MVRSLKFTKRLLRSIVGFCAVDACMEPPFLFQIVPLTKGIKYVQVCFKGYTIRLWDKLLFGTALRCSRYSKITENIQIIY